MSYCGDDVLWHNGKLYHTIIECTIEGWRQRI